MTPTSSPRVAPYNSPRHWTMIEPGEGKLSARTEDFGDARRCHVEISTVIRVLEPVDDRDCGAGSETAKFAVRRADIAS